ncbi:MAG: DUF6787 family protein [Microscillaceae bacterium]|nr:DUF6787 family protein [Microscillaceae bacterium]
MKSNWIKKLQQRWGLQSIKQVILVLAVFSCTGFSVLFLKEPILWLFGLDHIASSSLRFLLYLLIILPVYQVLLLAYGFLFGQFHFFWNFEKKMFHRLGKMITSFQRS